ncbi:MAG: response regulator transcription factor [Phycisphaeraceae bacterium]
MPTPPAYNTQQHSEEVTAAEENPIRVLLADDHKILRDGLANLLREQPDIVLVGEVGDGQAAVDRTRELHPDVVVMDITMPRLTGIEATRMITRELPDVRIIGLSMHEHEDMASAMHNAGAVAYLTKDGDVEALIRAIRDAARKE